MNSFVHILLLVDFTLLAIFLLYVSALFFKEAYDKGSFVDYLAGVVLFFLGITVAILLVTGKLPPK